MGLYRLSVRLLSPLFRRLQQSARARNIAERMLQPFPSVKTRLVRMLYVHASADMPLQTLDTGVEQQRIYEELHRRLKGE